MVVVSQYLRMWTWCWVALLLVAVDMNKWDWLVPPTKYKWQGCTIAIEFAKITEHFLNLLNSIVIEPRLVSKWKKSEGRYCYWYCTSSSMIIEFNCVIEILSLCILLLKLRLKCHFSSSTIATEIEKLLCAYCYWSWDWIVTFPHPLLQPKLKSYCV